MLIWSPRERHTLAASLALSSTLVLLSGCGIGRTAGVTASPALSPAIAGNIHGGQQPISGTPIQIWTFGASGYGSAGTLLATSSPTDAAGGFQFAAGAYTCPQGNAPVYLIGNGGNPGLPPGTNNSAIALGTPIGPCSNAPNVRVHINEVTTAAMAYSLAQFFTASLGANSTDAFGGPSTGTAPIAYSQGLLAAANNTFPNLVDMINGVALASTSTILRENSKINSMANVLAACVNTNGRTSPACTNLFINTTPSGGTAPSDTLQAAVQMVLHPFQNVTAIYNVAGATSPFTPALSAAPHDWTLGLAYKSTAFGLGVNYATTSNLDIDSSGRVWIPATTPTGGVVEFDPATSTFAAVKTQPGLLHPQNLAVDNTGYVWTTDFKSSLVTGFPATVSGANLAFNLANTNAYAIAVGYANDLYTAYHNTANNSNGLGIIDAAHTGYTVGPALTHLPTYLASGEFTYDALEVATNDTRNSYEEDFKISSGAHAIAHTYAGITISSQIAITYQAIGAPDDILTFPTKNEFCSYVDGCKTTAAAAFKSPQGMETDGTGFVWIADAGSASVSATPGYLAAYAATGAGNALHNAANGNTMVTPYGLAIDNSGNVWVSNATCVGSAATPACTPASTFTLSELVGAAAPTITPLAAQSFGAPLLGTEPIQ